MPVTIESVRTTSFSWEDQIKTVEATVTNESSKYLPAGRLFLTNDGFRRTSVDVPDIQPFGSTSVRVVMHSKQGGIRSAEDIGQTTQLVYEVAETERARTRVGGVTAMHLYTSKFSKKPNPDWDAKRFNILIFGLYGCGKSAFINTVMTLMSPNDHVVTNAAMVGGGEEHTTTKLRATRIPDNDEGGMVLWDTWGVSEQTYTGSELELILNGVLANNWDMSSCDRLVDFQEQLQRGIKTRASRQQHAVIFMFPYTLFGDVQIVDPRVHDAKCYFKKFLKEHIQPLILISQADAKCPQLRTNPMRTYPETEAMRRTCARQLGVPLGHVYLAVNYVSETTRSYELDRNTFRILEAMQNRAAEHLMETASKPNRRNSDFDALDWGSDDDDGVAPPKVTTPRTAVTTPRTTIYYEHMPPRPHSAQPADTSRLDSLLRSLLFAGSAAITRVVTGQPVNNNSEWQDGSSSF